MGRNGLPSGGNLVALATDPSGSAGFYAVDAAGGRILQFSPTGQYLQSIGPLSDPSAITVDAAGDVYAADMPSVNNFRLQKFSPSGSVLGNMNHPGPEVTGLSAASGALYVCHFWAGVDRLDLGTPIAAISSSSSFVAGGTINLSAAASAFPFGTISDYKWDLTGSGQFSTDTGSTPSASTSFSSGGSKTVSVEVVAANGTTATASLTLNVNAGPSTQSPVTPGAPAVPAPPIARAPIGVSINAGDYATDTPDVTLDLSSPVGTASILVSNDGGFGTSAGTKSFAVTSTARWTLRGEKNTRAPATVYVQYSGPYGTTATYTDDIILDETSPTLTSAVLVGSGGVKPALHALTPALRRYKLRIVAAEQRSGISAVETSSAKSHASITTLTSATKQGSLTLNKTITISARTAPSRARVQSAAGKWSRWLAVSLEK
jgi:hypothetical protein